MNSTDGDSITALIRSFHAEEIVPLAARLAARGKSPFPLGFDPQARSYFVERTQRTMEPADFEVFGPESPGDFEQALARLWTQQGWTELAPLAPRLAEIARALYFVEDQDDEVSPFIYVMF